MPGTRVLILGATGMLGHKLFTLLGTDGACEVWGTARTAHGLAGWFGPAAARIRAGVSAEDFDSVVRAVAETGPEVVINAVGIVKQAPEGRDPLQAIAVNALFPHRLAALCRAAGVRLVHISTDCVFSGEKGNYTEDDPPDARDLYGRTKLLGEPAGPGILTLRTSIIGHELRGRRGLVEWFLGREGEVRGFTRVVFSGLPTVELARVLRAHVIPDRGLAGLYHVSSAPIAKYRLLRMIAARYGRPVTVEPDDGPRGDRSLDSTAFRRATGYDPPPWPELVDRMFEDYTVSRCYRGAGT